MSSHVAPEASFADRNHFLLRRLHSLTGIIPIGAFLIEHLLTNSRAFGWFGLFSGGAAEFNKDVHWIHHLPYLLVLEILFIFAPLAFHAGYGVVIALTAEPNYGKYRYGSNLRYSLQRLTGWIALVFIIVHLLKFRFAHLVGWNNNWPVEMQHYVGSQDPFLLTWLGLNEWTPFGFKVPAGATFAFYVLGLWAAVFHFCNGIWTFCITWGITIGEQAQKRVGYVCVAIAAVLLIWGHGSLYAFKTHEPLKSPPAAVAAQEH